MIPGGTSNRNVGRRRRPQEKATRFPAPSARPGSTAMPPAGPVDLAGIDTSWVTYNLEAIRGGQPARERPTPTRSRELSPGMKKESPGDGTIPRKQEQISSHH